MACSLNKQKYKLGHINKLVLKMILADKSKQFCKVTIFLETLSAFLFSQLLLFVRMPVKFDLINPVEVNWQNIAPCSKKKVKQFKHSNWSVLNMLREEE